MSSSQQVINWAPPPSWDFRAADIVEEQAKKTPLEWLPQEPEQWLKDATEITSEQAASAQPKKTIYWPPREHGWLKTGPAIAAEQASRGQASKPPGTGIIYWPAQDSDWIKHASDITSEQASGGAQKNIIAWRPRWFWKERASDIIGGQAAEAQQTSK